MGGRGRRPSIESSDAVCNQIQESPEAWGIIMIDDRRYPMVVEFMGQLLYQDVLPFREKVEDGLMWPAEERQQIVAEIADILASGYSDGDIDMFIMRHSDYMLPSGRETLREIARILSAGTL
jgi:hypothetical protein